MNVHSWFEKKIKNKIKNKKSKLHGETKTFFNEIQNREKGVDKKRFLKYLSHEHTTLVNKLLDQNIQDLRKSLDEIKQQKIELNKDEGNSTNTKNENDILSMILSEFNNFLSIDFCRVNNQMN